MFLPVITADSGAIELGLEYIKKHPEESEKVLEMIHKVLASNPANIQKFVNAGRFIAVAANIRSMSKCYPRPAVSGVLSRTVSMHASFRWCRDRAQCAQGPSKEPHGQRERHESAGPGRLRQASGHEDHREGRTSQAHLFATSNCLF